MDKEDDFGVDYCNECPFLCYHEKHKKYVCGPYNYYYKDKDFKDENTIIVPDWCGNKKIRK
jgi:hypothetical protein